MSAISHVNFKGDSLFSPEGKTNLAWFFFYFLLYLVVYGYAGLRLGINMDEVIDSDGRQVGIYIAQMRWGIGIYRMLFGYGSCYGIACLAAGFLLSANLVLVTHIMKTTSAFSRFVAGCFFFSVLSFCCFSFLCDAVALGFLCCTLGMKCLVLPWSISKGALAVFLIAFGIACYQTLALYFIALWLVWQLRMYQLNTSRSAKEVFKSLLRFACIGGLAFIVFFVVNAFVNRLPCVSPAHVDFNNVYHQKINGWNSVAVLDWPEKIDYLKSIVSIYIRNMIGLGYAINKAYASAVLPVCFLSVIWLRRFGAKKGIIPVLMTLALWCLPYMSILVMAYPIGAQSFLAEPFSLAYLWILLLSEGGVSHWLHKALFVLLPFLVLKSAYIVAEDARFEQKAYKKTVAEVHELTTLIRALEIETGTKVIVMGGPKNICGGWALHYYLNHLGLTDRVRFGNDEDAKRHRSALRKMTNYPEPGCIREDQGVILLRMGKVKE